MYRRIYGLSGTLGSEIDRIGMSHVHGISTFDVPTHCNTQRVDFPTTIKYSEDAYYIWILEKIEQMIKEKRPVLVLCEEIEDTLRIAKKLKIKSISFKVINDKESENEQKVSIEKAGLPGDVTVATSEAGRGTNIRLEQESILNGGLHVILTFYPQSLRVEQQGRGRAGRQGQPGSSEIILYCRNLPRDSSDDRYLENLEKWRIEQTEKVYSDNLMRAVKERYCFQFVELFYSAVHLYRKESLDEKNLNHLVYQLSNRKLIKTPGGVKNLRKKDREIGQLILRLLTTPKIEPIHWRSCLNQVIKRVEEKSKEIWSLEFYEKLGEKKMEMEEVFEISKASWGKYLDPSLDGIVQYMRDVTGASLININTG